MSGGLTSRLATIEKTDHLFDREADPKRDASQGFRRQLVYLVFIVAALARRSGR
jgi:hypothetical protein